MVVTICRGVHWIHGLAHRFIKRNPGSQHRGLTHPLKEHPSEDFCLHSTLPSLASQLCPLPMQPTSCPPSCRWPTYSPIFVQTSGKPASWIHCPWKTSSWPLFEPVSLSITKWSCQWLSSPMWPATGPLPDNTQGRTTSCQTAKVCEVSGLLGTWSSPPDWIVQLHRLLGRPERWQAYPYTSRPGGREISFRDGLHKYQPSLIHFIMVSRMCFESPEFWS